MTPYWQQVLATLASVLTISVAVWGVACAAWWILFDDSFKEAK